MQEPQVDPSFEALTPTAFLERSSVVHRERPAVVDGDFRLTYGELHDRSLRLAGALRSRGVEDGDRVAALGANAHLLLESHYGVPLAGAVLVALNVRLAARELGYILEHSGARTLLCDPDLDQLAEEAVAASGAQIDLIRSSDGLEQLLSESSQFRHAVADERDLIALNYTSGTTGRPKGVMYHHRGAYLQALAMAYHTELRPDSVFLWTLPMFHCNGWCFTWGVTAAGATHLCLPKVDPELIWDLIETEGVTHFNAAPTVLTSLAYHDRAAAREGVPIKVATGGAPPSPTLLARLAELNMEVTHLYGLTETFGPVAVCDWHPEWDELSAEEQAGLKARQGVPNVIAQSLRVIAEDGRDAPADGETLGEVAARGNDVMLGYYRDPEGTDEVMGDGWFRTGDLGVMHPDGYLELRDRAKDVIISGGENIASVEVEQALLSHPAVLEVAVIPIPDEKWGERPAAFVTLKPDAEADAEELTGHARERLAKFKVPSHFEFRDDLPKTSTGKIQKYVLRDEAWAGQEHRE